MFLSSVFKYPDSAKREASLVTKPVITFLANCHHHISPIQHLVPIIPLFRLLLSALSNANEPRIKVIIIFRMPSILGLLKASHYIYVHYPTRTHPLVDLWGHLFATYTLLNNSTGGSCSGIATRLELYDYMIWSTRTIYEGWLCAGNFSSSFTQLGGDQNQR